MWKMKGQFCIYSIYNFSWNYVIDISSNISSFREYNFEVLLELFIVEHIEHGVRSFYGSLSCSIQYDTFLYTRKIIFGHVFVVSLFAWWPGMTILRNLSQQRSKTFQCGRPFWVEVQGKHFCHVYVCGCVVNTTTMRSYRILYVSKIRLAILPYLLFFCVVTWVFELFQMMIKPC